MLDAAPTGAIRLAGPAFPIQADLELPPGQPAFAGLVCHPHPLYGGTQDNKVVTSLARAGLRAGGAMLRFNFRGVGQSGGSHDGGQGETDDTVFLAGWLRERFPDLPLWLAGFSFGSMVAARTAAALAEAGQPVAQLLLVAPPVERYLWPALAACACPVTVIQGEADDVVEPAGVLDWAAKQQPKPATIRIAGAGHFFHGQLAGLMQAATTSFPDADRFHP